MTDLFMETLDSLVFDYEIVACDPALADTAEFCQAYGYSLEDSANTIVVIGKSDPPAYVACVVLASTRLDVNKVVKKRMGVRSASFAPGSEVERLTGMTIGGVTPFGLPPDLPLWIDGRVMKRTRIILGGGSRDRKLLASPEILAAIGGVVVEGLARIPT